MEKTNNFLRQAVIADTMHIKLMEDIKKLPYDVETILDIVIIKERRNMKLLELRGLIEDAPVVIRQQ